MAADLEEEKRKKVHAMSQVREDLRLTKAALTASEASQSELKKDNAKLTNRVKAQVGV